MDKTWESLSIFKLKSVTYMLLVFEITLIFFLDFLPEAQLPTSLGYKIEHRVKNPKYTLRQSHVRH